MRPLEFGFMPDVATVSKIKRVQTAKRYSVCVRTIERWEADPDLGFPPCMLVNGRRYDDVEALNAWDAKCAARFIQSIPSK
jgi:hypothetical protein